MKPVNAYTSDSNFDRHALRYPDGQRKAALFDSIIPEDCHSILDVGGGTGWVTMNLRDRKAVVTLDSAFDSLKESGGDCICADIGSLPFPDQSFDLVLSSQVLEHLDNKIYKNAIHEMRRVARRYILVSVPYRENLLIRHVVCPMCGHLFHRDQHVRAFDERTLHHLVPGWILSEWFVFGALDPNAGVRINKHDRNYFPRSTFPSAKGDVVCPRCGKKAGSKSVNTTDLSKPLKLLRLIKYYSTQILVTMGRKYRSRSQKKFLPSAPYWIAGLHIKGAGLSEQ